VLSTTIVSRNLSIFSSVNLSKMASFKRVNPMSDKINVIGFHHIEFFSGDATSVSKRFRNALGVELVAKSDFSTGNSVHASYAMQSGSCRMLFTAPYHAAETVDASMIPVIPFPAFSPAKTAAFFTKHGLAAYAVAIVVEDVPATFNTMVANGGIVMMPPVAVWDKDSSKGYAVMAEISLYGEVALRLLDTSNFKGAFLPNFQDVVEPGARVGAYGINRIDHIVGNVHNMKKTCDYIKEMTVRYFHTFLVLQQ
jgi:4-hydroxyphenylpyruvate dioxygenase